MLTHLNCNKNGRKTTYTYVCCWCVVLWAYVCVCVSTCVRMCGSNNLCLSCRMSNMSIKSLLLVGPRMNWLRIFALQAWRPSECIYTAVAVVHVEVAVATAAATLAVAVAMRLWQRLLCLRGVHDRTRQLHSNLVKRFVGSLIAICLALAICTQRSARV